jgi:hypothetical protein
MAKLQIKRDIFNKALERSPLSEGDRDSLEKLGGGGSAKSSVSAPVRAYPLSFLQSLLDDSRLSANQRAVVALHVFGMARQDVDRDKIYQMSVSSPVEFGSTFVLLGGRSANCEIFMNGRWYPATMGIQFVQSQNNQVRNVVLHTTARMCETSFGIHHVVYNDLFLDDLGNRRERTVGEILRHFGYRPLQTDAGEFNLKLVRAERAGRDKGKQVLVTGPALGDSRGFWCARFVSRALGTAESPRKAIIEHELEVEEDSRSYYSHYGDEHVQSKLPFIRVFSLDLKAYLYVDIDDVEEYEFDEDAMQRLHLPDNMLSVLTRVFSTPVEDLFGDLISGKHGGVVILASGNPGVGKTLTAEVYAEHTNRPLYVLELGELGTNAQEVETNLRKVFARVSRWNAVLQFDECEIFLTQRANDLERSAIVGIFLRLLDYYQGILFLTTNRCDVLDHAVLSRVMLKLAYPDLDVNARRVIWKSMFEAADLKLTEGSFEQLAESVTNGRQIRNLTRLAEILHPSGELTLDEIQGVLEYGSV